MVTDAKNKKINETLQEHKDLNSGHFNIFTKLPLYALCWGYRDEKDTVPRI